jgi:hypothetical protein
MSCWVLVAWVLWLNAVTFAAPVAQDISCLEGLNSTWPKFQMDAIDACDTAGVRCGVTPESGGSRRVLAIERPGSGFYGPIPQSLRNCTALRVLYVHFFPSPPFRRSFFFLRPKNGSVAPRRWVLSLCDCPTKLAPSEIWLRMTCKELIWLT